MKRVIDSDLLAWVQEKRPMPLLIRGARQVGKSWTLEELGSKHFSNVICVNFEFEPQLMKCFENLDPEEILKQLAVIKGGRIEVGKTLLILDEIQECKRALLALRYFFEKKPGLHVAGAGSLLEFRLKDEAIRFPVGRIQSLFMKPMSFMEFLEAGNQSEMISFILEDPTPFPEAVHERALELFRDYLFVGGMPAAVMEFYTSGDFSRVNRILKAILQTYRDDFGRYARFPQKENLELVFQSIPRDCGKKITYSRINPDAKAREVRSAIELLEGAQVIQRVFQTSPAGLPLGAGMRPKAFKALFLDVGLMQVLLGSQSSLLQASDLLSIHSGAIAEQVVGQELLAYQDPYEKPALYYWAREKRTSSAEIDYLIDQGGTVVPIEVKAGKSGRLKSMQIVLESFSLNQGVQISSGNFNSSDPNILQIPLYAIGRLTGPRV